MNENHNPETNDNELQVPTVENNTNSDGVNPQEVAPTPVVESEPSQVEVAEPTVEPVSTANNEISDPNSDIPNAVTEQAVNEANATTPTPDLTENKVEKKKMNPLIIVIPVILIIVVAVVCFVIMNK